MGEKTVIFVNSCIKFAALCGMSGPAANEPAHFFDSFLCASKEMNKYFTLLFVKAKPCEQRNFVKAKHTKTFALLFSKAETFLLSF